METVHPTENDIKKEASFTPTESMTPQGVSAMQGVESPPLPHPENSETLEVSKAPEAIPGKDDGNIPATAHPSVSPSIPDYDANASTQIKTPNDWKDLGIVDVPVADLPSPDGVSSPDDFNHHISWEDAKSATEQLPQLQKEVSAGKIGDDFTVEDEAAGLDYQNGRRRLYDLYYSPYDPVQVDKMGNQYFINSGRHRIFAAKELGLNTIPARVKEKNG
jgi:hypothetical protein